MSAGEIGTKSEDAEKKLTRIFDIASHWKAVLLLDEADVFVEQRAMTDAPRNALVCVFLRKLEYLEGILFLTTNRVKTIDEAIASRIHLPLRYVELDGSARKDVWKSFLSKGNATKRGATLTSKDFERLAKKELNGREVRSLRLKKSLLIESPSRLRMPYRWRKLWQMMRRAGCNYRTSRRLSTSTGSFSWIFAGPVSSRICTLICEVGEQIAALLVSLFPVI